MIMCPIHNSGMLRRTSEFGPLHVCPIPGCDILKWGDNDKTTPADTATRKARHVAHGFFDNLWRDGHMTRTEAYQKLADHLGMPSVDSHIGLFEIADCEETVRFAHREQKRILLEKFK